MTKLLIYALYAIGKLRIKIPTIIKKDILHNNKIIENYKFEVFPTKNKNDYDKKGSICYLSQYKNKGQDFIFKVEDVNMKMEKNLLLVD